MGLKKRVGVICLAFAVVLVSLMLVSASFEINSAMLKFSVKQGDFVSKPFGLKSVDGDTLNLFVENLQDVSLSDEALFMSAGESRDVSVMFNSSEVSPGAYVGYVSVRAKESTSVLPIILEVESKDVFFDANLDIPPLYSEVAPGNQIIAQVKMFDLTTGGTNDGLSPASVDVDYTIYRNDGIVIASESETLVINHDSGITKSMVIPKDALEGDYFMVVKLTHGTSVGISSEMFRVSKSAGVVRGLKLEALSLPWFAGLFGVIAIIALFMLFFFLLIRDRDRFMLALRKYHDSEMEKQRLLFTQQRSILQKKKNFSAEKFESECKIKIKELKLKQKDRVKELRKLKKTNDESAIEAKLEDWKRKGYNTLILESKLNELSTSDMKKIMSKWKKEGYKLK